MQKVIRNTVMCRIKTDIDPDNIRVELWAQRTERQTTGSDVWAVRLIDLDSDEVVGITKMDGDDAARVAFNHYTSALRGY